jgi:predicted DNA-binding protein with PD1-like motif
VCRFGVDFGASALVETIADGSSLFIRVDPGEQLVATLHHVAALRNIQSAVVVSGVGMFSSWSLASLMMIAMTMTYTF